MLLYSKFNKSCNQFSTNEKWKHNIRHICAKCCQNEILLSYVMYILSNGRQHILNILNIHRISYAMPNPYILKSMILPIGHSRKNLLYLTRQCYFIMYSYLEFICWVNSHKYELVVGEVKCTMATMSSYLC